MCGFHTSPPCMSLRLVRVAGMQDSARLPVIHGVLGKSGKPFDRGESWITSFLIPFCTFSH